MWVFLVLGLGVPFDHIFDIAAGVRHAQALLSYHGGFHTPLLCGCCFGGNDNICLGRHSVGSEISWVGDEFCL